MMKRERTKQVIIDTKQLLSDPERWTKNTSARDVNGNMVAAKDDAARCWCLFGAVRVSTDNFGEAISVSNVLCDYLPDGYMFLTNFNDSRKTKHEDVIGVLDKALGTI